MSLRILGGTFRNRPLKAPKGDQTRPTSSLLRAAIFDICSHTIEDAHFLDLFAGSGAMGLEALSRGAAHATFMERHPKALTAIRENISTLSLKEQTAIIPGDVLSSLKLLSGASFDIIYADPPYAYDTLPLIKLIDHSNLLNPSGSLFIEEATKTLISDEPLSTLTLKKTRTYGDSRLRHYLKS